jgi:hypothetical protein
MHSKSLKPRPSSMYTVVWRKEEIPTFYNFQTSNDRKKRKLAKHKIGLNWLNFGIKRPVKQRKEKKCTYFLVLVIIPKFYIPSTLNIDLILWHTQLIVCAENVIQGFFLLLLKLISWPIDWIVCVLAYLNFIFEFWSSFSADQNGPLCPDI